MEEEIDTGISGYFSVSVFSIYLGSFSRVDVRLWKNKDLRFSRIICRRPDETIPVSSGLSLGLEHRGVRSPAPGSDHRQTSVFGGLTLSVHGRTEISGFACSCGCSLFHQRVLRLTGLTAGEWSSVW